MREGEFDALDFAAYARERWLTIAISCGVAACLAFGVSKVLPRKYTATVNVLIAPPGGNDPRAATAVSPVYLESLKSYERYASSDTLFARAVDAVHARDGESVASVESLKNRALKVSKPAGTAVLEISVTLRDPKKALALAQYVAQQTVELNESLEKQSSTEWTNEARKQLSEAQARNASAQQARRAFAAAQPVESLENEVQNASELKLRLERDLEVARTDLADYTLQREALPKSPQGTTDEEWLRRQVASIRAKIVSLEVQTRELSGALAAKGPELEERKARMDGLESDERSASLALDTASKQMNEVLSSSLTHGERLQIIDPGIVPQSPSAPNTILNLMAATLLSLIGSMVWLAFRFGHARMVSARSERAFSHSLR